MIKVNRQTPGASTSLAHEEEIGQAARAAVPEGTERNRGDSMTQRDSSTSADVRPARDPAPLPAPLSPVTFAACSDSSFWENWYAQADPDQRQQVVELARQQGVLCSAQLPAPEAAPRRPPLSDLLATPATGGAVRERLEPLAPTPILSSDPDLDEAQRLAVARALATPDVALVQGHAGSGKTRV